MDVVRTNIARLGGVIEVQSELGIGTKFTITLPITLAIIRALLIEVADHVFAVPIASVQEVVPLRDQHVRTIDATQTLSVRGQSLVLTDLAERFGLEPREGRDRFVVLVGLGNRKLGVVVDGLREQRNVIIKSLGASLAKVKGFAGATDLGDQKVALVVDVQSFFDESVTAAERQLVAEADSG